MPRLTKKKAIEESIAHWERMIAWAEKQDLDGDVSVVLMLDDINEWWSGKYCSLCKWAEQQEEIKPQGVCKPCPLFQVSDYCDSENSFYYAVNILSHTWGEWVDNARKMLAVLKGLK